MKILTSNKLCALDRGTCGQLLELHCIIILISTAVEVVSAGEFTGYPGITNCTQPGLVALTFDDGPSSNGETQKVLDVLREKNVKATFFVTGRIQEKTYLDADERKQILLKQIYEDGHQIGSHTWSHSNLIRNRTKEYIFNDISRLSKTVYNILGVNMTILRPPYGLTNETVVKLIQDEFKYQVVRWNLDTKDWYYGRDIDASFRKYEMAMGTEDQGNRTMSFITLHHDPVPRSEELASKVIDYVRAKGFKLVTVGECIGVPDYA